jgi:uncharacterized membrane protein
METADQPEVTWPIAVVFLIGLLATPGFLAMRARTQPDTTTRWYAYLIALIAFVPWALAASFPVRDLFNVRATGAEFTLAAAVFVIPLLDFLFGMLTGGDSAD